MVQAGLYSLGWDFVVGTKVSLWIKEGTGGIESDGKAHGSRPKNRMCKPSWA